MYAAFTGAAVMGAFTAVLFFRLDIREAWGVWSAGRSDGAAAGRQKQESRYRIVERKLVVHTGEEEDTGGV